MTYLNKAAGILPRRALLFFVAALLQPQLSEVVYAAPVQSTKPAKAKNVKAKKPLPAKKSMSVRKPAPAKTQVRLMPASPMVVMQHMADSKWLEGVVPDDIYTRPQEIVVQEFSLGEGGWRHDIKPNPVPQRKVYGSVTPTI